MADAAPIIERMLAGLAALHDESADGVMAFTPNEPHVVLYANQALSDISGHGRERILGARPGLVMTPDQHSHARARIRAAIKAEQPLRETLLAQHADGAPYLADVTLVPLRSQDGQVRLYHTLHRRAEPRSGHSFMTPNLSELILEHVREGVAIYDPYDRLVFANDGARRTWGLSGESVVGRQFAELVRLSYETIYAGEQADVREQHVERRLAAHRRSNAGPFLARLVDGRWLRVTETETPDGWLVVMDDDVTGLAGRDEETERRETQLRQLEHQVNLALEAMNEGFALFGPDDRLIMSNARYRSLYAKTRDLIVPGISWEEIVRGGIERGEYVIEGDPEIWFAERKARHDARQGVGETQLSDGRWFQVIERRTEDGGLVSLRVDITDAKRAEQEMQVSRDRFERAVHASGAGIWEWSIPSDRFYCSARAAELQGLPPQDQYIGYADFLANLHSEDRVPVGMAMERHLAGDGPFDIDYRLVHADGGYRWFHAHGECERTEDGRPMRMAGSIIDVTRSKEQEAALNQALLLAKAANRTKSAFLATMSHELRTPLNAIIGFSDLLAAQSAGTLNSVQVEYVELIRKSSEHLLSVINSVLDFSRIEAGRFDLADEEIEVAGVAGEVIAMQGAAAMQAGVTLALADRRVLRMRADPRAMRQMLINLVANAVKFTPPGGRITLGWKLGDGGRIEISVEDTGVGIPPEERDRMVEPFVQAGNPLTRSKPGSGLGLSIVKSLIEAHGGSLSITAGLGAGSPGTGTRVTLFYPIDRLVLAETM